MEQPPSFEQHRELYLEKPLPSSPESEKVVLGAILLDNSLMGDLPDYFTAEDFYSPNNKRIFKAYQTLFERGDKIDPVLVGEELKKEASLESIGGVATIANLTYGLPHFSSLDDYTLVIYKKARSRALIKKCNEITSRALAEEEEVEETLIYAEEQIFSLTDSVAQSNFVDVTDLADLSIEKAQTIAQSGNPVTGIETGFLDIDSITLGLQRTDLIIVAARPSVGKTAFGVNVGQNAAFRHAKNVAVFSLEMSKEQLTDRVVCSEAKIDSQLYRSGLLTEEDWGKVHQARQEMAVGKLHIDDTPGLTTAQLRQKLRRLVKKLAAAYTPQTRPEHLLDLVLVDYIGLMVGDNPENRQQEVSQISRELKGIAKTMNVPLVVFSQLNRGPENRANHRPNLGDLRESGAIEQDADVVAFIFRESMYPKADGLVVGEGEAEIIFAKQRNGPTGMVKLAFDKKSTRFDNFVSDY